MDQSGYGPETQLALDDGWIAFVEEFERLRDETVMVEMEERDKHAKPMVPAPKYSRDELLRMLDLGPDDDIPSEIVAQEVHPSMWDFYGQEA